MLNIEKRTYRVLAFLLAVISVILISNDFGNYSILVTYSIFLFILRVIDSIIDAKITHYYNFYVIASWGLISIYQLDHGTVWNGPDDQLFYETSIGENVKYFYKSNITWEGYYYLLSDFYLLIREYIDANVLFYHGILLNIFFSSFIPFFFVRSFEERLNENSKNAFLLIMLLMPHFVIYNVTFLRDSFVMLGFSIVLYSVNISNAKVLLRYLVIISVFIMIYYIRPASSMFLIIYLGVHFYFQGYRKQMILFGSVFLGYLLISYGFNKVSSIEDSYIELANSESASNSIGLKLLNNGNPIIFPIKFLYVLFSPIPPTIIFGVSLKSIYFSIGDFLNYFFLTLFFLLAIKKSHLIKNKENFSKHALYIFLVVIIVLFSSKDPRHLRFLFPLIFFQGLKYMEEHKSVTKNIVMIYLIPLPLIITAYILIKYQ